MLRCRHDVVRRLWPTGADRLVPVLIAALLTLIPVRASGQGAFDAILTIPSFPSPYFSDWESIPEMGSLTLINNTPSAQSVRVFFSITDQNNRVVASGRSAPTAIASGGMLLYDSPFEVAGASTYDAELEEIASRTGRLPEGDFTACASAVDDGGFVLAESCAGFFIVYPDPPLLLGPEDGAVLVDELPLFQWSPVQVPGAYPLEYVLRVAELRSGQLPAEALASNIPQYEGLAAYGSTLRYPLDALPLESGRTYAWSVRALDDEGYAASANEGRSEIWTFTVEDESGPPVESGATVLRMVPAGGEVGVTWANVQRQLCGSGPVNDITIPIDLPAALGLEGGFSDTVTAYRSATTAEWALLTRRSSLTWLLYGDCEGVGPGPYGLQWLAVRRSGKVGDLMSGERLPANDASEMPLRYGVTVLSLIPSSTELPDSFSLAREFLDYREIDLRPGLNVFGVVDVRGVMADVLRWLGYADPSLELQGFIGVDRSFSVGGFIGGNTPVPNTGRVEASEKDVLMVLSASLPERPTRWVFSNLWETAQVGVDFIVQDSAGVSTGSGGGQVGGNLDMILQMRTTLTGPGGAEWTGTIGLKASQSATSDSVAACSAGGVGGCFFYLATLKVDEIPVGPLGSPIRLTAVQIEAQLTDGFVEMVRSRDPGRLDWDVVGTASLGIGPLDDVANVMIGLGRAGDEVRASGQDSVATTALAERRARRRAVVLDGPPPEVIAYDDSVRAERRRGGVYDAYDEFRDEDGAEDQAPVRDAARPAETPVGRHPWRWGVRVALGNMSIAELIGLLRLAVQ